MLFQFPEWLLLILFLGLLVNQNVVPLWAIQGLLLFWVVKDIARYPLVRRAYERSAKTGAEELIGTKGTTQDRLDPEGYVKVHGELWKARTDPVDQPIDPNTTVEVKAAATGMTLIVRANARL